MIIRIKNIIHATSDKCKATGDSSPAAILDFIVVD